MGMRVGELQDFLEQQGLSAYTEKKEVQKKLKKRLKLARARFTSYSPMPETYY